MDWDMLCVLIVMALAIAVGLALKIGLLLLAKRKISKWRQKKQK